MKRLKLKISYILLFSAVVLSFVTEIAVFVWPWVGKIGWMANLFIFLAIFALSLQSLYFIFKNSWKYKSFFSLLIFFSFIFLLTFNFFSNKTISGETTIETNCILNHLTNAKDKGYHQTCLFGYPAKQYYLSAIPSLLFGRSKWALNLGGSLYFLLALPIFIRALFVVNLDKKTPKKWQQLDLLIALLLSFLFHIHFLNHFLFFLFEQSNFPFSLGLLSLALFLLYQHSFSLKYFLLLVFSLFIMINAYTPALAGAILGIAAIIFLLFKQQKHRIYKLVSIVVLILMLVSSFFYRSDFGLAKQAHNLDFYFKELTSLFEHLLLQNRGAGFFSIVFTPVALISLFVSLFNFKKINFFLLSLWILGTLYLATISEGYAFYGFDFRMHRALVIMPIWLMLIFNCVKKISFSRKTMIYLLTFYLVSGIFYQFQYIQARQDSQHWLLIKWLKQILPLETDGQLMIADKNQAVYLSLNDELQYFYPNLQTKLVDSNFEKNCEFADPRQLATELLLIDETHSCKDLLIEQSESDHLLSGRKSFPMPDEPEKEELKQKKPKILGIYRREKEIFYLLGR